MYLQIFLAVAVSTTLLLSAIVTERKRAEQALKESEVSLLAAQRVARAGSWAWHIQSNQLEWSDEMYTIFGIEKESFTGNLSDVVASAIHPEDRAKVEASNLSVARDKQPVPLEYRVIQPDGTVRMVWAEAGELRLDEAGNPVTLTGIVQDITERKQAEEALQENELQHRKILQATMDGFWLADLQGHLLEVNDTYCRMSGYSVQELLTMRIPELEVTETADDVVDHMQKIISQGEDRFETRHRRKDGTIYDVENSVQYRSNNGGRFVSFIHDITNRKQAEEDKRQFYRNTIKSVTQGKLDLVLFEDVKEYLDHSGHISSVNSPVECATVRSKILDFCRSSGLADDRQGSFELAVGEAITNAIKHADSCQVYAGIGVDSIWVAISDSGQGISTTLLPSATLRRGFSSKVSMGMGYTIMMEATDNIMLCTSTKGTTVVLSVNFNPSKTALSLDDFPDTWDEIADV